MIASRFTAGGDPCLHYLDSDEDDRRPPVVFVPGMTDITEDYIEVATPSGRRLVIVEMRGHGRSSAPLDGYDLATLSRDVGIVVAAVTDGPVHLVTFSRGPSYAVQWAIDHPDRVLSIAIGDYLPEERIVARAAAQSLTRRPAGADHLFATVLTPTPQCRRSVSHGSVRSGNPCRTCNCRCSPSGVSAAASSAMPTGSATASYFPPRNWSNSTTHPTTSSDRTAAATPPDTQPCRPGRD